MFQSFADEDRKRGRISVNLFVKLSDVNWDNLIPRLSYFGNDPWCCCIFGMVDVYLMVCFLQLPLNSSRNLLSVDSENLLTFQIRIPVRALID